MKDCMEIKKALNQMGITPDLKGYHYLAKGVEFVKQEFESERICKSFMQIYKFVGDYFDANPTCVERCMRSAIKAAENNKSDLFCSLFSSTKCITVSTFISVIAEYLLVYEK